MVAGAERAGDDHLRRDRQGVERERPEPQQVVRDLVRADGRVRDARGERREEQVAAGQRDGAHEQQATERRHPSQRRGIGSPRCAAAAGGARHEHHRRRRHHELRDHGAEGGAVEIEVQAVDEHDLRDEVHRLREEDESQREPERLAAAEPALAGDRDELRGDATAASRR